ncbi:GAF and ANTAR domain-containing protein [Nocardioides caeni]|uniref:GAF and ANTAR domain-containing protein n=1 Tax=Nocardioides caeni TaxID=574700 RepID=A0A4S8N4I4_9ACTN|nr:GAF and ANTAR domain-containing protein [Nocardioides caeni]THV10481.1 GAF and ANTAR domain-containing protein [Nocardioides caeni]
MTDEGSREAAHFARLSADLLPDLDPEATGERVCRLALVTVPAGDFCSLTVRRRRGRLETLAETDELAGQCDALQYELGEGPCMESALEDQPFLVPSTATDPRWPRWGPKVAELGAHGIVSVQLKAPPWQRSPEPLGAINIYCRERGVLSEEDLRRARLFAVPAAQALALTRLARGLDEAVESRHRIGLAQGILMQRFGIDPDAAFGLLERRASESNTKLRDVAAEIVAEGGLPQADNARPRG